MGAELGASGLPMGEPPLHRLRVAARAGGVGERAFPWLPAGPPARLFPRLPVSVERRCAARGVFPLHAGGSRGEDRRPPAPVRPGSRRGSLFRLNERAARARDYFPTDLRGG